MFCVSGLKMITVNVISVRKSEHFYNSLFYCTEHGHFHEMMLCKQTHNYPVMLTYLLFVSAAHACHAAVVTANSE